MVDPFLFVFVLFPTYSVGLLVILLPYLLSVRGFQAELGYPGAQRPPLFSFKAKDKSSYMSVLGLSL